MDFDIPSLIGFNIFFFIGHLWAWIFNKKKNRIYLMNKISRGDDIQGDLSFWAKSLCVCWAILYLAIAFWGKPFWTAIFYFSIYFMPACIAFYFWVKTDFAPIERWILAEIENAKPKSNITKHKDIADLSELLSKTEQTKDYGSPLLLIEHDENHGAVDGDWAENSIKVRVTNEDRGLVIGLPGSGKTAFLISQLIDWMSTGQSIVATDVKPEIWARLKIAGVFERYGYTDTVFNPTDAASHAYNLFSDAKSAAEITEILNVIIPKGDESAEVFAENARRLLLAVLLELDDKASLPNAQEFINEASTGDELLSQLKRSENAATALIAKEIARTAGNGNLMASIFTSLNKAFAFMDDSRIREQVSKSDFSLKDLLSKPKQAVFLQFDQEYKNTTASLFGAMVAQTVRILQSNYRQRDAVFVALDEIINCAPIPNFTGTLNTIRSAKMPTFLYFQSLEGLNRIYGQNAEKLFLGATDLQVVFRTTDDYSTTLFSRVVGETEAIFKGFSNQEGSSTTPIQGQLRGLTTTSSNSGESYNTQILQVFEPEKFRSLETSQAVCIYRGAAGLSDMPSFFRDYGTHENWPREPFFATFGELEECKKTA